MLMKKHMFYMFHFQWEVFSVPELQNFMKILDKEEEEHILQVCNYFDFVAMSPDKSTHPDTLY